MVTNLAGFPGTLTRRRRVLWQSPAGDGRHLWRVTLCQNILPFAITLLEPPTERCDPDPSIESSMLGTRQVARCSIGALGGKGLGRLGEIVHEAT